MNNKIPKNRKINLSFPNINNIVEGGNEVHCFSEDSCDFLFSYIFTGIVFIYE